MILRRLRLRAGIYISALLLFAGLALGVQATQPVTRSEMESFVFTTLAGAGIAVVGSFWVLLQSTIGRTEKAADVRLERVEKLVGDLVAAMKAHHEDPLAHPAGSANRIDPINARLDELREALQQTHDVVTALHAEHQVIRGTEDEVCAVIRSLAGKRDPNESPKPRRKDDPSGTDNRPLRGKTP